MIEEFAKLIPESIKNLSGAVFYSGRNAFQGKKDLYIIGLNPGGADILHKDATVSRHTETILSMANPDWSEYKDEIWGGTKPGVYGLQPRILHLLRILNLSPSEIPASNVCFVRSPREINISDNLDEYCELCWPFHEKVINELGIKVILCFGKSAGSFIRKKLKTNKLIDEFVEKNDRRWSSQVFENNTGQIVIIATHPSIADWTNPNSDPSHLVKKYLAKSQEKICILHKL
jgi:hypothetical protein